MSTYIAASENDRLKEREEDFTEDLMDGVAGALEDIESDTIALTAERDELKSQLEALEGKSLVETRRILTLFLRRTSQGSELCKKL